MLTNLADCPLPKRSAIHPPAAQAYCPLPSRIQQDVRRPATKKWVAVGAGVAAVSLAAPVAAFASTLELSAAGEKTLGSFAGLDSWAPAEQATASADSELGAVTAAASRAKVRTPIEISSCVDADQSADGARGITQKASIVWPLQEGSYTETSGFSWRVSPISGELLAHEGVDWAATSGSPIYAAAPGVVAEVGYNGRSGNYVEIAHELDDGTTFSSLYMHQGDGAILVSVGQEVGAGDQIGGVGSTGWSTGPHLHFEIRDASGQAVDPTPWMQDLGAAFPGQACQ